jgi:putative glutamine amidotransferase
MASVYGTPEGAGGRRENRILASVSGLPLIGISAYEMAVDFARWCGVRAVLAPSGYVHSVRRAGGRPLLLPPLEEDVDQPLDVLDGVIVIGGPDLNPALYGQDPHQESRDFHDLRDRVELALLRGALERDLPTLGICRGMQLMNVLRGGDLQQHLDDVVDDAALHKRAGEFVRHRVETVPESRLASLLGERVDVHSSHHQAPRRIGEALDVAAVAPDGTVEAIEDPERRFAVGVLWHPEEDEADGAPLFAELVAEAAAYRAQRERVASPARA